MNHRTTFALDQPTKLRLQRLSASWNVSQAEVVRRAVALAEESSTQIVDRSAALKSLHEKGEGLVREQAEDYLNEVRKSRSEWRGSE